MQRRLLQAMVVAGVATTSTWAWGNEPTDVPAHAQNSWGFGFSGTRFVPAAAVDPGAVVIDSTGSATLSVREDEVTVPLFGVRYWLTGTLGFELAAGFNFESGDSSQKVPNPDPQLNATLQSETPSTAAFAVRFAVPISLYRRSHFNLLVLPELDVGYSSATLKGYEQSTTGESLDLTLTGFALGAGLRLGSELHFGFIDVPGLAFEAAWGFRFQNSRRRGVIGDAEHRLVTNSLGTSWYRDAWDVFVGGLAFRYYL